MDGSVWLAPGNANFKTQMLNVELRRVCQGRTLHIHPYRKPASEAPCLAKLAVRVVSDPVNRQKESGLRGDVG